MFKNKTIKAFILIFVIALFLELVVFNINSFRTFGKGEVLNINEANLNYIDKTEDGYVLNSDASSFEWKDLNKEIKTIKFDVEISGRDRISYEARIWYTDDTASYYYGEEPVKTKEIVNEVDRTKYFTCHFAGNVKDLKIDILNANGCTVKVNEVTINEQIPYKISLTRFTVIFGTMAVIYLLFALPFFNKPYEKSDYNQSCILKVIAILFILILFVYAFNSNVSFEFSKTDGNIYNKYLVDALMEGKTYIEIQPPEELMNMDNPYDYTARREEQVPYLYDYAYFDGHYYVYFSVLPALTLFLPFKLLTGYYFPIALACLIYGVIGSIFTILFTKDIIKKFFPNVSFRWVVLSVTFMLFSSFLLFNIAMSRVYELVSIMGYMLCIMGMYFALKAFENEKIKYKFLVLACVMLGLAVWARPNLIIVSLLLVPILFKKFINLCKQKDKKELIHFILSVVLPYAVIGICVMIYNYLRFGSILEFGAKYQLTSNDMGNLRLSRIYNSNRNLALFIQSTSNIVGFSFYT